MTWHLIPLALIPLIAAAPAMAQVSAPSALAFDTAAAIDEVVDEDGNTTTGLNFDAVASVDLGAGLQVMTRPSLSRFGSGEWNAQLWIAALRYERPGTVGIRAEVGYIPSPIGMANLLLRPQLNPTIAQPSSLFTSLPAIVPLAPRAVLLGALYPLGASVTASGVRWDVRAAAIDTSPLRPRRVFSDDSPPNPPRFPTFVVGGGITPFVGFRIGASAARTGWLKAGESPATIADRDATIFTIESEVSFRYTRLMGEWVRDHLETHTASTATIHGFFLQGQQTLSPRWFVAGRVERMSAPPGVTGSADASSRWHLTGIEETIGYRLAPEITIRASHRARRGFGASDYLHTASVSVVFWKRWR